MIKESELTSFSSKRVVEIRQKISSEFDEYERMVGDLKNDPEIVKVQGEYEPKIDQLFLDLQDQVNQLKSDKSFSNQKLIKQTTQDVQQVFEKYKALKETVIKYKYLLKRQTLSQSMMMSNSNSESIHQDPEEMEKKMQQEQLKQQLLDQHSLEDEMLKEQQQEINNLQQNAIKLAAIISDIGVEVKFQDESIQIITQNSDQALTHVQQANQEMVKAEDNQKRAQKKICTFIIIIMIGVGILALILWLSLRKKKK
eukprot:TRINITY_DN27237_c0_g1_i1.p1 TRINITY_DN27237_c0_g1~~TRINITY_DN27237_c0_g1_i1.p1  ORF type:complete len:255 (+),score=54.93 TRINITY_DN27237_c0_g1_i1:140-904(+)